MITAQDIREKTFEKAVFGGYDMGTIDAFLEEERVCGHPRDRQERKGVPGGGEGAVGLDECKYQMKISSL